MSKRDERTRNWTFVLYPESAPENWRDYLNEYHIQWIESPLHDKDINADGTPKKPHIHIMLMYEGNKSYSQIKEITDSLNQPIPQKVASARSMVRYMAHLDNPDKFQYDQSYIIGHGGVDIDELLKPLGAARHSVIKEMMKYVRDEGVVEFQDLADYAAFYREDWFAILCDTNTLFMKSYISSQRHRATPRPDFVTSVNPDTGEIIENG